MLNVVVFVGMLCIGQPYTTGGVHRCRQTIFVMDNQINAVRKLARYEIHSGIPGTGVWGQWVEEFCQKPNQKAWMYRTSDWPRPISNKEVLRLLGKNLYNYFEEHRQARVSCWYNFSGVHGYTECGVPMNINVVTVQK